MREILLSPEFQLNLPFFVTAVLALILLSLIFLAVMALLIERRREVRNGERFTEALLENLNQFDDEGGSAMERQQFDSRKMMEDLLRGVTPSGESGGNQTGLGQILGTGMLGISRQMEGLIQLGQQVMAVRATKMVMAQNQGMVEVMQESIETERRELEAATPVYTAKALGNPPPAQIGAGESASAAEASPAESSVAAPAPAPEAPASPAAEAVPVAPQAEAAPAAEATPAAPAAEVSAAQADAEALELFVKHPCVRNTLAELDIKPETFTTLKDLPKKHLDNLVRIFDEKVNKAVLGSGRKVCTSNDEKILQFLLRHQAERKGQSG